MQKAQQLCIYKNMKRLVIFYSFEGSTKLLAEAIAGAVFADKLELKPQTETIKSHGVTKYFWGCKQVSFKEKPKLEEFKINPNDYDIIFIGTPVWAWTYAPPLRSFLEGQKLQNKKIALFCAHEGGKGKVFEKMRAELCGNEFIGEKDFCKVVKDKEKNADVVRKWANEIINLNGEKL